MRSFLILVVVAVALIAVPPAAWATPPTKAVASPPELTTPFQALRLPPDGVAYTVQGATCQAGKPPAENPSSNPEEKYYEACSSHLIQASALINFPGVIFIGAAFGTKTNQFIVAPEVALGAGASIPLKRPSLNWWLKDDKYLFTLPDTLRFNMNFIASFTGSLGALVFPNAPSTSGTNGTPTEVGYSIGGFGAIEFAWTSWDTQLSFDASGNVSEVKGSGQMKTKIAFSIGILLGYLGNSEILGDAFIVGTQPNLTFKF